MNIIYKSLLFCFAVIVLTLFNCDYFKTRVPANRVYTLYRTSALVDGMRIHVATFDVEEKEEYNCENCNVAAELFQNQPGVITKFWCEKGYYKE